MRTTLFIGIIALFIFAISCINVQAQRTTTKSYEVENFSAVQSSMVGNITIRHANTFSVRAEGNEELVNELKVYVENGTLFLKMDERLMRGRRNNRSSIKIDITVPVSEQFEIASQGVGNITGENIEFKSIRIISQGVGSINLSGTADNAYLKLEGVGSINAEKLIAKNTTVVSEGVGSVQVHASESINVKSEGVGSVSFSGNPAVRNISNSGVGRVRAR
ncbi:MAG: DUF2807 domain-containing protein [Dysgonamonadaceae bacterium]|jgi:hypothetical protein|nr:DUF2807 domain-containing protein [Dysgonamonadaceae bacterium]